MHKNLLILVLLAAPLVYAEDQSAPPQETLDTIIQNLKNGRKTAAMVEYIDSISRFWGERNEEARDVPEGYMKLEDAARKLTQMLPRVEGQARYYGLVTRSYIGYEATGQAGYTDYRYVRIAAADVEGGMEDGNAR